MASLRKTFKPFQLKGRHVPVLLSQLQGDCWEWQMKHLSEGFRNIVIHHMPESLESLGTLYSYGPRHPVSPHHLKSPSSAGPKQNNSRNNLSWDGDCFLLLSTCYITAESSETTYFMWFSCLAICSCSMCQTAFHGKFGRVGARKNISPCCYALKRFTPV